MLHLVLLVVLSLDLQLDVEVLLRLVSNSYYLRQHEPFLFILLHRLPIHVVVLQPVLLILKVVVGVEITHDFVSVCLNDLNSVFVVALCELELGVDVYGVDVHVFCFSLLQFLPL